MNFFRGRNSMFRKPCLQTRAAPRNPALDFTSESFDPVKALSSPNIRLLFPKAKTYNNLAEYYSHSVPKKNSEEPKEKVIPKERNYSWYIRTLGLWGQRAHFFEENLKAKRSRNRRKGKKPISITYVPGSPLRSGKVIKLKSSYKGYWKRKCLLYKKGLNKGNISLFQKIRSLAKPLTASDLIQKAIHNCTTRTDVSTVENSTTDTYQTVTSSYVDTQNSACTSNSKPEDTGSSNSVIISNGKKKKYSKKKFGKSDEHFLLVKNKANPVSVDKEVIKTDCSNSSELKNGSNGTRTKKSKQNLSNNVLTSSENVLKTKRKSVSSKNSAKSNQQKTSNKLPKAKHLKSDSEKAPIKENTCAATAGCTCFPNASVELSSLCKCGFYSNAMKNVKKFKIPRKKLVNN